MQESTYNVILELDHEFILLNTLSLNMMSLSVEESKLLQQGKYNNIENETYTDLVEGGFLVEDAKQEKVEYLKSFIAQQESKNLSIKLLLSTTCNSKCVYCYQQFAGYTAQTITGSEVSSFCKWLQQYCSDNAIESLSIELFGGEPLLASSQIPNLLNQLNFIKSTLNIPIDLAIITNTSLLTKELAKLLCENDVELKISIDGRKDTHDYRRPLKNGVSSYESTFSAIKLFAEYGRVDLVTVRYNLDKNNYHDIEFVAKQLHELGVQRLYCGEVMFRGKKTPYTPNTITTLEMIKKGWITNIYSILSKYEYTNNICNIELYKPCQFYCKHSYVVSPTLEIAKCDELLDIKEYQIGKISPLGELVLSNDNYNKCTTNTPEKDNKCWNCNLLPICGRGCPIEAMNTTGSPYNHVCENIELMKEKIKLLLSNYDDSNS